MVVLNSSPSFHGIKKKRKEIIKNIAWIFADCLLYWQPSLVISWFWFCPLQTGAVHLSTPHTTPVVVLELQWSMETVGQGLEGEIISSAGIIPTWFSLYLLSLVLLLAQRAASKDQTLWVRNPHLTLVPGLPWMRDRPWSSRTLSKAGGLYWSWMHVNVHNGMFLTRSAYFEQVPF